MMVINIHKRKCVLMSLFQCHDSMQASSTRLSHQAAALAKHVQDY